MHFGGDPREGGFCLVRQAKGCERPFAIPITVASLSGASAEPYCGIDQDIVTCEAVLDAQGSKACAADEDCGCPRDDDGNCVMEGQGGLCRTFAGLGDLCTYQCGAVNHCITGLTCNTAPNPDYCE